MSRTTRYCFVFLCCVLAIPTCVYGLGILWAHEPFDALLAGALLGLAHVILRPVDRVFQADRLFDVRPFEFCDRRGINLCLRLCAGRIRSHFPRARAVCGHFGQRGLPDCGRQTLGGKYADFAVFPSAILLFSGGLAESVPEEVMTIPEDRFAATILEIGSNFSEYEGKTLRLTGYVAPLLGRRGRAILRHARFTIGCGGTDLRPTGSTVSGKAICPR